MGLPARSDFHSPIAQALREAGTRAMYYAPLRTKRPEPPTRTPTLFATYLQPGVLTVFPGGWHFAPGSCGPFLLLPGPKSGAANAAPAPPNDIVSANMAAMINIAILLRMCFPHSHPTCLRV
jgi:hypothetical protein